MESQRKDQRKHRRGQGSGEEKALTATQAIVPISKMRKPRIRAISLPMVTRKQTLTKASLSYLSTNVANQIFHNSIAFPIQITLIPNV